jgi:hypothetical protein
MKPTADGGDSGGNGFENKVAFKVNMVITGCSAGDWRANSDAYTAIVKATIIKELGVDTLGDNEVSVTLAPTEGKDGEISGSFTVKGPAKDEDNETLKDKMQTSLKDGAFTETMQEQARTEGAVGMTEAKADVASSSDGSNDDTGALNSKSSLDGEEKTEITAAIAAGIAIGAICFAMCLCYGFMQYQKKNQENRDDDQLSKVMSQDQVYSDNMESNPVQDNPLHLASNAKMNQTPFLELTATEGGSVHNPMMDASTPRNSIAMDESSEGSGDEDFDPEVGHQPEHRTSFLAGGPLTDESAITPSSGRRTSALSTMPSIKERGLIQPDSTSDNGEKAIVETAE